jgi:hypothetical protein
MNFIIAPPLIEKPVKVALHKRKQIMAVNDLGGYFFLKRLDRMGLRGWCIAFTMNNRCYQIQKLRRFF